jgi:4'-phosphopantetheinyl transferase
MAGRVCEVWWAEPVAPDTQRLDGATQARMARLRRTEDRQRHATGVVLLDSVVAARGGPDARVVRTPGEPLLVTGAALHASVAHAGAWVAVALCAHAPVGVDVEPLEQELELDTLAEHVLTPAERETLAAGASGAAERRRALLTWWTRKEAVVKATGDGLRVEPARVQLAPPDDGRPPRLLAYPGRPELPASCTIADLRPGPDAVGAVAVLSAVLDGVLEHDGRDLLR